jgi:FKBP-type peptidyl-prolyl cis-trans isomerase FkpA
MFGRRHLIRAIAVPMLALTMAACGGDSDDSPTQPTEPLPQGPATLQITDLTVGEGAEAVNGRTAFIGYSLWRFDPAGTDQKGLLLQTNTFSWVVGSNQAIAGMSQGVVGMKVGGKRRLVIPPSLAYGAQGTSGGEVRPNEWIVFEVELLSVV